MTTTAHDAPPDPTATASHVPGDVRTAWGSAVPFLVMHVTPLAAVFVTVTWQDWALCGVLFAVRMFCITAGYHRYFAHRSYRTSRVFAFLLALGATTAAQKGPLWWAGHHRTHHRFTDGDDDVHSPRDGFWWSHVGWILSTRYKRTDPTTIRDFAAHPEIRWLDRWSWLPPWVLGVGCLWWGGWGGLLIGFCLSTVLLWHSTFLVNSVAHLVGRRRFATPDTSRNSFLIALVTGGEGWHNNHHYLPASARQGFAWWELDPTWYALRLLALVHVVHDLRTPPARLLHQARVGDGAFDIGMFRWYWERAAKLTGNAPARLMALAASATGVGSDEVGPEAAGPVASASGGPGDAVVEAATTAAAASAGAASDVGASGGSAEMRALSKLFVGSLASADRLARATRLPRSVDRTPASDGA